MRGKNDLLHHEFPVNYTFSLKLAFGVMTTLYIYFVSASYKLFIQAISCSYIPSYCIDSDIRFVVTVSSILI